MKRISSIDDSGSSYNGKSLLTRVTGRFYTHPLIGHHLVDSVLRAARTGRWTKVRVVEPFCGDGRLVCWLLESINSRTSFRRKEWEIDLWDCDADALKVAKKRVGSTARRLGLTVKVNAKAGDAFTIAPERFGDYHICLTNPPWELLKPDRREVERLSRSAAEQYLRHVREQDELLAGLYPLSAPLRRFSGWGMNLARCGTEVSLRLIQPKGVCGIVSPASLLADRVSEPLRKWIFEDFRIRDIAYYVAEAKLFERVDQPSITIVASSGANGNGYDPPTLTRYDRDHRRESIELAHEEWKDLALDGYVLPLQFGVELLRILAKLRHFPRFKSLEEGGLLWAGRELDETGHQKFLAARGKYRFAKGRMIKRYGWAEQPQHYVKADGPDIPASADLHRLVWRDVSRPNQRRRIHASLIPPGVVTGNSLSVAYFRDNDQSMLKALLAIMNSLVFEAQARAFLATAHVSLGAVRQVRIPDFSDRHVVQSLAQLVDRCMKGDETASFEVEVEVAQLYALTREEFATIISSFEKIEDADKQQLVSSNLWGDSGKSTAERPPAGSSAASATLIPNHYSATLSELDLRIARSVPPGGNWKNIPESIPSDRLKQIRVSFAAGKGSRSTYYGRLRADAPAYTINTYFTRPGNGCHLHYDYDGDQHRTLSQREASRLQSFPDSFVFRGSKSSINQQIGNAVPPLLAYQLASRLPVRGNFVDLFSGAGGLSLGFSWAQWTSLLANDLDESFLQTYRENIHENVICGDIRNQAVFEAIVDQCKRVRSRDSKTPLFVLGGPPCQGFSTAGNKRSMEDDRNWLFRQYVEILRAIRPDGFIFENVPGLLNMEGGRVFDVIRAELESTVSRVSVWRPRTEEYAVPQRRTRLILVGDAHGSLRFEEPQAITSLPGDTMTLFGQRAPAVTVRDALSDLPPLESGEDGSMKNYVHDPVHPYQAFMRSLISVDEYLEAVSLSQVSAPSAKPSSVVSART